MIKEIPSKTVFQHKHFKIVYVFWSYSAIFAFVFLTNVLNLMAFRSLSYETAQMWLQPANILQADT